MSICICGGGNVAHAMAAMAALRGYKVRLLTRRPNDWQLEQRLVLPDLSQACATLELVSSDASIVRDCEYVFIVAPQFAVEDIYAKIEPYITSQHKIILVPGCASVHEWAQNPWWRKAKLMVLQKVAYISRSLVYGREIAVKGSRPTHMLWCADSEEFEPTAAFLRRMLDADVQQIKTELSFLLSNSNPLLHPSRMCVLFKGWKPGVIYPRNFLFYQEWTEESSELYIAADKDLADICRQCPDIRFGKDYISVLEYYESTDAVSLTRKISGIKAFQGITSPMKSIGENRWIPDLDSRYFTEDIPMGTAKICNFAKNLGVATPTLDYFVQWHADMIRFK